MRLLVIIYEFPPVGGGGGQAARDICHGLAQRGHSVRVLTSHWKDLPEQENQEGVEVLRLRAGRRLAYQASLFDMSAFILAGLRTGLKQARAWQPDLIHVHFAVPSGPVAWGVSHLTHIPYILTAHLGDVPKGVPEKTDRWFRWIYPFTPPIWRDAAQVVAVSEHTRRLAAPHYPVNMQIIPNGVDLSHLDPGNIQAGNPPRIAFAGRFMSQKNPLELVRILSGLQDLDWNCVMIGDGPLRPAVEQEIRQHGLQERFTLPGWIMPEEVITWLRQSDILLMPSLSEGLPVVGVQSLAMGLAIVASRIGGFMDLVDPGVNGKLVEIGDQDGFRNALRELICDPARLQAARLASRRKAQDFDISHVVAAYEKLFLETIEQRGAVQA